MFGMSNDFNLADKYMYFRRLSTRRKRKISGKRHRSSGNGPVFVKNNFSQNVVRKALEFDE